MSRPRTELIVTADDFGAAPGVNEAVERAYRGGILRFASLMVRGPASADAVRIARANPGLGVGVHLDLCPGSPASWGLREFLTGGKGLEAEIDGQIRLCLSLGITPTHIDSHMNVHVHPTVFPLVVRAARLHGIPRVRLTGGEVSLRLGFGGRGLASSMGLGIVFGALGAWLRRKTGGLVVPDRTLGLLRSGMMTEDYLLWVLPRLPKGLTEVYCHPTADPAAGRAAEGMTPSHHSYDEFLALSSPRVRERAAESGISLAEAGSG